MGGGKQSLGMSPTNERCFRQYSLIATMAIIRMSCKFHTCGSYTIAVASYNIQEQRFAQSSTRLIEEIYVFHNTHTHDAL